MPGNTAAQKLILFGIRSPIVVEFEETCYRLSISITAAISVNGAPRIADGSRIVAIDSFKAEDKETPFLACAFTPARRAALIEMARARGLILAPALIDPTAILARTVHVGAGSFINAGTVIGALSIIGEGVLINRAVSLGHHTVLGDYVSIGPGATLAGNIHVGYGAVIGAGAVVLPNIRLGAEAVVAAGSLVRHHVPDGACVAGNPATKRSFNPAKSSLNVEDGE